jgi:hypothetical protein
MIRARIILAVAFTAALLAPQSEALGRAPTEPLTRVEDWTGNTERFPDSSGLRVAFTSTVTADVAIWPQAGRNWPQCVVLGDQVRVKLELWDWDRFNPDDREGGDRFVNGCSNNTPTARWDSVQADDYYIKGYVLTDTQGWQLTQGDWKYWWKGDPDDPFVWAEAEKR